MELNVNFSNDISHLSVELLRSALQNAQVRLVGPLGAAKAQWEISDPQRVSDVSWRAKVSWRGEVDKEDIVLFNNAVSLVSVVGPHYCSINTVIGFGSRCSEWCSG